MAKPLTEAELEAYLDEALSIEVMTRVERALRDDPKLVTRLAAINGRRDAGLHSLGEIWRRHRLSCPPREQLGSYLLGVLPVEVAAFIKFHVEIVGCRVCLANLDDLRLRHTDLPAVVESRRKKYFQSSAGRLGSR